MRSSVILLTTSHSLGFLLGNTNVCFVRSVSNLYSTWIGIWTTSTKISSSKVNTRTVYRIYALSLDVRSQMTTHIGKASTVSRYVAVGFWTVRGGSAWRSWTGELTVPQTLSTISSD